MSGADERPPTAGMLKKRAEKDAFCKALAETGVVTAALDAIGRSYNWFRWHREKDPEFADAVAEAESRHADSLEKEAIDRATGRKTRQVTYKGQLQWQHDPATGELLLDDDSRPIPVMEEILSDRLLEKTLAAKKPEYRDHKRMDVRVAAMHRVNHQVSHTINEMTVEQQEEMLALLDGRLDDVSPETLLAYRDAVAVDAEFEEVGDDDWG